MSNTNFYNSGIYLLVFANGDKYVGQAKDFDTRWRQHFRSLEKGKHTKLLQQACTLSYGEMPNAVVLLRCHPDYLDYWESYYINTFNPNLNATIPKPLTATETKTLLTSSNSDLEGYYDLGSIMEVLDELGTLKSYKYKYEYILAGWEDKVNLEMQAIEGFGILDTELSRYRNGWWGRLGKFLGLV